MSKSKVFTADDGSKFELVYSSTAIGATQYQYLQPVKAKRPKWTWEPVVIGDTKLEVIYDNPKKDWIPSDNERMYIYHAIEWVLRTIQYEADYNDHFDGRSSLNEYITKARNALNG